MIKHIKTFVSVVLVTVILYTSTVWAYELISKQVTVTDYDLTLAYKTSRSVVRDFLTDENITLGKYDKINVDLDSDIQENMAIEIKRAIPVKVKLNDINMNIISYEKTVKKLLQRENIVLKENDEINVKLDDELSENMKIEIKSYGEQILEDRQEITFETKTIQNPKLNKGVKKIVTQGVTGERLIKTKIAFLGGKESSREVISEEVTKQPVTKVIQEGTREVISIKQFIPEIIQGTEQQGVIGDHKYSKVITMNASAYTDSLLDTGKQPGDPGYGVTKSGMKTKVGVVAVDTRIIPLMTKLYIEGYGFAVAADTGSAIKGNKIDLYMNSRSEAISFGRRNTKVYVLE